MQGSPLMQGQQTRRLSQRLEVSFLVHCQRADFTEMGGRAYNAGVGGMAIKTNYPVRVGDELTMELRVPNAPCPVRVAGEVTWRKFHGDSSGREDTLFTAGIKFLEPKEASRTILYDYIQSLPNLAKTEEGLNRV